MRERYRKKSLDGGRKKRRKKYSWLFAQTALLEVKVTLSGSAVPK
jgi:hypothetical protein